MRSLIQGFQESLAAFAADLKDLSRRALQRSSESDVDEFALEQFLNGIREDRLRERVLIPFPPPCTLGEARDYALCGGVMQDVVSRNLRRGTEESHKRRNAEMGTQTKWEEEEKNIPSSYIPSTGESVQRALDLGKFRQELENKLKKSLDPILQEFTKTCANLRNSEIRMTTSKQP